MRMSTRAASAAAIVVAVSAALPLATASAASRGSLVVCNDSDLIELNVWADGPSFREENYLANDCTDWYPVRAGQYDVGASVEDLAKEADVDGGQVRFSVKIKRNGHTTVKKNIFSNGFFTISTNVAPNQRTRVEIFPQASDL